jgi:hypothetical protein
MKAEDIEEAEAAGHNGRGDRAEEAGHDDGV